MCTDITWKKILQAFIVINWKPLWNYWLNTPLEYQKLCNLRTSKYNQTCSNNPLYKTATCLRRLTLSPPKQIPIQSLLSKMTTCLTWPATTFFVSQMKKNLSKTITTKFYPEKKWETNIKQQCIKITCLCDFIYSIATL